MQTFRVVKKPVVVEAQQFRDGQPLPWGTHRNSVGAVVIDTKEGHSYPLKDTDWVIKGVKGEFYPIDDAIFRETYGLEDGAPIPPHHAQGWVSLREMQRLAGAVDASARRIQDDAEWEHEMKSETNA